MKKLQEIARVIWLEVRDNPTVDWSDLKVNGSVHKRMMAAARAAMAVTMGVNGGTEWRPIPGFPRYEASNKGTVRRAELPDGSPIFHELAPHPDRASGHLKVSVYRNGQQFRRGVHQLVALAFHGEPPPDKPFACHRNGIASDCRPENIRWGSREENVADMILHNKLRRGTLNQQRTLTKEERDYKQKQWLRRL